jgi:hypothetical protein
MAQGQTRKNNQKNNQKENNQNSGPHSSMDDPFPGFEATLRLFRAHTTPCHTSFSFSLRRLEAHPSHSFIPQSLVYTPILLEPCSIYARYPTLESHSFALKVYSSGCSYTRDHIASSTPSTRLIYALTLVIAGLL